MYEIAERSTKRRDLLSTTASRRLFAVLTLLMGFAETPTLAQSDLPPSAQVDLIKQRLNAAQNTNDCPAFLSALRDWLKLGHGYFEPSYYVGEAKCAYYDTRDLPRAKRALDDYLKVGKRGDPLYGDAIALYGKVEQELLRGSLRTEIAEIPGEMVYISGGRFQMGSNYCPDNRDHDAECGLASWAPIHWVNIRPFKMSRRVISKEQFDAFAAAENREPVNFYGVPYDEAMEFVAWISQETHHRYRLPTEAEYEYVTTAGGANRPSGPHDDSCPREFPCVRLGVEFDNMEFVSDCWHFSYDGAPTDGASWDSSCEGAHTYRSPRGSGVHTRREVKSGADGSNGLRKSFRLVEEP